MESYIDVWMLGAVALTLLIIQMTVKKLQFATQHGMMTTAYAQKVLFFVIAGCLLLAIAIFVLWRVYIISLSIA